MRTKRNYTKKHLGIEWIWPVFSWHQCIVCDNEFRRMPGWMKEVGPYWGSRGHWEYICSECAPDIEAAATKYDESVLPVGPPPTAANELHQEPKASQAVFFSGEPSSVQYLLSPIYIVAALSPEAPEWFQHSPEPGEPHPDTAAEVQTAWAAADAESRYFQWRSYFARQLLLKIENAMPMHAGEKR